MPTPTQTSGKTIDLSPRIVSSNTVVGSPAAASATNVCQVTGLDGDTAVNSGVFLSGVVSLTVGTSGTAVTIKLRRGTTAGSGTTIASSGALTATAGNLICQDIQGFDTNTAGGQAVGSTSYFIEITVTGGAATSTVSQTNLIAIIV